MTYPQDSSVQSETLALGVHDIAVLHTLILGHKGSLVQVGVELLMLALNEISRVESLNTVLLERAHEDSLGHLQTGNKIQQVLVGLSLGATELVLRHGKQGTVEVVNALEQVNGELLDGEAAGLFHVTLCALLEVEEVRDRTDIFVLFARASDLLCRIQYPKVSSVR